MEPDEDVELLTRLLAFERVAPGGFPNKKLNKFLNKEMRFGSDDTPFASKARIRKVEKALQRAQAVFGDYRFRPYRVTDKSNVGEWARPLNRALMEVQVHVLLDHADLGFADAASFDAALSAKKDELLEYAKRLHIYNDRFNDTIQRGTTGKPNVEYRYERYREMIKSALADVPEARRRRFFTVQQKQTLWDRLEAEDRTCAECTTSLEFDDADVDHVKPFSEGGETTLDNAQLLHRACNRAKGARWDPVTDGPIVESV